jgi:hypothetical protein
LELSPPLKYRNPRIAKVLLPAVTLVDFPQFRDTYHIIPKILGWQEPDSGDPDPEDVLPEDWEAYLWYRKVLTDFLTDPVRAGDLFVDVDGYVQLAKHIWEFVLFRQVFFSRPSIQLKVHINISVAAKFGNTQQKN